ncbi:hypothetical protein AYI70_g7211, partial [Smittium culicis]
MNEIKHKLTNVANKNLMLKMLKEYIKHRNYLISCKLIDAISKSSIYSTTTKPSYHASTTNTNTRTSQKFRPSRTRKLSSCIPLPTSSKSIHRHKKRCRNVSLNYVLKKMRIKTIFQVEILERLRILKKNNCHKDMSKYNRIENRLSSYEKYRHLLFYFGRFRFCGKKFAVKRELARICDFSKYAKWLKKNPDYNKSCNTRNSYNKFCGCNRRRRHCGAHRWRKFRGCNRRRRHCGARRWRKFRGCNRRRRHCGA